MPRLSASVLTICVLSLPTAAFAFTGTVYPLTGPPDIYVSELVSTINYTNGTATSLNLTGDQVQLPNNQTLSGGVVEAVSDVPGSDCDPTSSIGKGGPCQLGGMALSFVASANGFSIVGQTMNAYENGDSNTETYLSGTFVNGSYCEGSESTSEVCTPANNGEYGELFKVTYDNVSEMSLLEQYFASADGSGVATDLSDCSAPTGCELFINYDSTSGDADLEPYYGPLPPTVTPEPATLTLLGTGLLVGLLKKRMKGKKL